MPKILLSEYQARAEKRGRIHRFAKWCAKQYGGSWRGIYEYFRSGKTLEWKWIGVEDCIREYCPSFTGTPYEFWDVCRQSAFIKFMGAKRISPFVLRGRFRKRNFSELELKGIKNIFGYWLENVDKKKEEEQQ